MPLTFKTTMIDEHLIKAKEYLVVYKYHHLVLIYMVMLVVILFKLDWKLLIVYPITVVLIIYLLRKKKPKVIDGQKQSTG